MKIKLTNRALLEISGADSEDFLHNQFSNDIKNLDQKTAQVNAYCQHQGRIIALIWVMKKDDIFYLSVPAEMLSIIQNRLQMFVVISDVIIKKSELVQIGILSSTAQYLLCTNLSIDICLNDNVTDKNLSLWEERCIKYNIAEVYKITTEKFIPQMLNLDIDEFGVNFSKGCYVGQEVIARVHYIGKAKTRLAKFNSKYNIKVGDKLISSATKKPVGTVVRMIKSDIFIILVTINIINIHDNITINNNNISLNND